jgi:hypothetical protein
MKGFPPAEMLLFGLITIALFAPEQIMSTFVLTLGKIASTIGSMTTGWPMIFIDPESWHSTSTFCALRNVRPSSTTLRATAETSVAIPRILSRSLTNFVHSLTVFMSNVFEASFMTDSIGYVKRIYGMGVLNSRGD